MSLDRLLGSCGYSDNVVDAGSILTGPGSNGAAPSHAEL
jgi:hypothetical protein